MRNRAASADASRARTVKASYSFEPFHAPLRGSLFMAAAMFAAAAIDTAVKALSGDYSTAQIVLVRTLFALPLAIAIARFQGGILDALRTRRPWWHLYRGLLGAGATFGFFYGLKYLPLVTAVLLAYVAPLFVVMLSYPLLRERVSPRQAAGVLIGFAGTLCIVRPDGLSIQPAVLAIFGSAFCWALMAISNRQLAGKESPASLSLYSLPVSGVLAAVLTWGEWVQPAAWDWSLFAVAGVGAASIHFLAATASRFAPAATLAPIEYTNLIWAALAAYLFWADVPDLWLVVGGSAILLGGVIAVRAN